MVDLRLVDGLVGLFRGTTVFFTGDDGIFATGTVTLFVATILLSENLLLRTPGDAVGLFCGEFDFNGGDFEFFILFGSGLLKDTLCLVASGDRDCVIIVFSEIGDFDLLGLVVIALLKATAFKIVVLRLLA